MRVPEAPLPDPCSGCRDCAMRCSADIPMTRAEFDRIVEHLRALDANHVFRVLTQEKEAPWFEDVQRECCLFLDMPRQDCLIYPVRPLVCRLFGRVEWLPCPAEKLVRQLDDGWAVFRAYAKDPRRTFTEWQVETGLFDFRAMLREANKAP